MMVTHSILRCSLEKMSFYMQLVMVLVIDSTYHADFGVWKQYFVKHSLNIFWLLFVFCFELVLDNHSC